MNWRPVVLVGPRASGKTALAGALARAVEGRALDTDAVLATRVGVPAGEYLAAVGEPRFRELEERVVLEVLERVEPGDVVALGGGAVLSDPVRARLRKPDLFVVRLHADPQVLLRRMRASSVLRPRLTEAADELLEIQSILTERDGLYREVAQLTLETRADDFETVQACVAAVLKALEFANSIEEPE